MSQWKGNQTFDPSCPVTNNRTHIQVCSQTRAHKGVRRWFKMEQKQRRWWQRKRHADTIHILCIPQYVLVVMLLLQFYPKVRNRVMCWMIPYQTDLDAWRASKTITFTENFLCIRLNFHPRDTHFRGLGFPSKESLRPQRVYSFNYLVYFTFIFDSSVGWTIFHV